MLARMDAEFGLFNIVFPYLGKFVSVTIYLEAFVQHPNTFRIWVNENTFADSINITTAVIKKKGDEHNIQTTLLDEPIKNWVHANFKNRKRETAQTGTIELSVLCVLVEKLLNQYHLTYLTPFITTLHTLFNEHKQIYDLPALYAQYTPGGNDLRHIVNTAYEHWQSEEAKSRIYASLWHEAQLDVDKKTRAAQEECDRIDAANIATINTAKQLALVRIETFEKVEKARIDEDMKKYRAEEKRKIDDEIARDKHQRTESRQHEQEIRADAIALNMIKNTPIRDMPGYFGGPEMPPIVVPSRKRKPSSAYDLEGLEDPKAPKVIVDVELSD